VTIGHDLGGVNLTKGVSCYRRTPQDLTKKFYQFTELSSSIDYLTTMFGVLST